MDPEFQRRAQARAAELGLSFAEYVRRLVGHDLGAAKRKVDVSVLFDLDSSREPTDIARYKDDMIDKALWNEHRRKTSRRPHRGVPTGTKRR